MTIETGNVVPIWTLTTDDVNVPVALDKAMTAGRLAELRSVLAVLAESPVTTLEVRPRPEALDTSHGMKFGSASPIAQQLATFAVNTPKATARVASSGETLYRMVVPARVASQVSGNILKPMTSSAAAGGVHSALVGSKGISAQATFVPVTAGAAAGAMAIATPLVLLAVAAGASVYAEQQRKAAIEKITLLLEKLHQDRLDDERNQLDGCRNSIDKATAVLLDNGNIGATIALGPAVYAIDTAIAAAERRVKRWRTALDRLPADKVELPVLAAAIEGIDSADSEFYAHLELADLAIALKRRVVVLQAVEHAQQDEGNEFKNFAEALKLDTQNLEALISELDFVRLRLSSLEIDRSHGLADFTFGSSSVDKLLHTTYRLRKLGDQVSRPGLQNDVAIDILRREDGSVTVLPPAIA
ncbi:hypothetical protein Y710_04745 [Gordonia sp. QH-12]|uniref:hypothetical protein n=1 Tax=Gordonia sp. QH-12 TaxID=1437876 RepID=UPI000783C960|nr:hypothetical protein [Gordonia sp. QH-12]KXT57892.1 hypothetical protein Y710_04745 [Gordonia sp. QH-12]